MPIIEMLGGSIIAGIVWFLALHFWGIQPVREERATPTLTNRQEKPDYEGDRAQFRYTEDPLPSYCATCGAKQRRVWTIERYDTNTGKPVYYEGILRCRTGCIGDKDISDYISMDAYEWEHRHDAQPSVDDYFMVTEIKSGE